jgi:hypothetical protein
MKKNYAYLPFWFLLILPPLLLLTGIMNFVMCVIALIIGALILKVKDPFSVYYKNIWKLYVLSILGSFLAVLGYGIPEFFRTNKFLLENLVTPLEYNPYKKLLSFVYIAFIFIIIFFVLFKLVKRLIVKKISSEEKNKLASIFITIFIMPYLFLMPSTLFIKPNKSNLDDFIGTLMKDKTSVVQIMKNLALTENISSYTLVTNEEPYTLHIYLQDVEAGFIKNFEMDAATIFLVIKDVNEVVYHLNNISYTYDINKINSIFGNIKKTSLNELQLRYGGKEFKNYMYLGRLEDYDVFDESEFCEEESQLIYESNGLHYYMSCTKPEDIKLYKNGLRITSLQAALKDEKITVDDLINSDLIIDITGNEEEVDESINK